MSATPAWTVLSPLILGLSFFGDIVPLRFALLILLFLGACLGHCVLVIASHNWWYGYLRSRHLGDLSQCLHGLLLVAGPVLFGLAYRLDLRPVFSSSPDGPWWLILAIYVLICWFWGFVIFPAVTCHRYLRRPPAVLASNHTRTLDVAKLIGNPPVGNGAYHYLARLPGNELFQVDFAERTLHLPRLPAAWDGLSILHLSDLHFFGTPDRPFFDHVMDACAAWEPDVVAITGDIVDSDWHYRWIVPVLGRLRWRVAAFAILGNHDYYYEPSLLRRRLRKLGMHVLNNGWTSIEIQNKPLVVIGHEGPWFQPAPDLQTCPREPFRLCLSHTPDNLPWAKRHAIDLMLSGHNHGGQIQLPVIGSILVPSRFGRRYDCGTFHEAPTVLHVSRGLSGQQPIRYNCRPEATKIILRCTSTS